MNIVIDMNLSPRWADWLARRGHDALHWSAIGAPGASDWEIMDYALQGGRVVFTHDLDFGAILASTGGRAPSVLQIRTQDPTPSHCGALVLAALHDHAPALLGGALVSVDERRARVRILPLA